MNRYSVYLAAFIIATGMLSCKKNKTQTTVTKVDSPVTYPDYTVLKPGNYWIYQVYEYDSAGAVPTKHGLDSLYCGNDTVVNGITYHQYYTVTGLGGTSNPTYATELLRDSLSYTVTFGGHIEFSSEDFLNVFRSFNFTSPSEGIMDTILVTEQMGYKDASITVDAGTFVTSAFRQIWYFPNPPYLLGVRDYDSRYAQGVGLVLQTTGFYTNDPVYYERHLLRYHVQ